MDRSSGSWGELEALAAALATGDDSAWAPFLSRLVPKLEVAVRYQKIGRLRTREDDLRNIVVAVVEKLHANDCAALVRYAAMDKRPSLRAWMRSVVRNAAIDYMRGHAEYRRRSGPPPEKDAGTLSSNHWITIEALSTSPKAALTDSMAKRRTEVLAALRDHVARAATAHRAGGAAVSALADTWQVPQPMVDRLIDRGDRMVDILELLFQGHRYGAIADSLGLSRRQVEVSLGHVEELLSRRFADDADKDQDADDDGS